MKIIKNNSFSFVFEDKTSIQKQLNNFKNYIGKSQIVALGENAHFIKEFFIIRDYIVKYLIQKCGFDTVAFEFGFNEGIQIDKWIKSELPINSLDNLLSHFYYPTEFKETLGWLRKYNSENENIINFIGLDVPKNGGSYFPNLNIVADYIRKNDPSFYSTISRLIELAKDIDYYSTSQAALVDSENLKMNGLELTALLSKAYIRLVSLNNDLDNKEYQSVLHNLKGLIYTDYNIHAMRSFISECGLQGDMSARDKYMAESVEFYLRRFKGKKVILIAHNAHIQKTPVAYGDFISCYPMGQKLSLKYGNNYKAFGITNELGFTSALYPDTNFKFGFKVDNFKLNEPEQGSIEHLLKTNGLSEGFFSLNDFDLTNVNKIRLDSTYIETDLKKAFDGIFIIKSTSVSDVIN